jgi:hypothetical protein
MKTLFLFLFFTTFCFSQVDYTIGTQREIPTEDIKVNGRFKLQNTRTITTATKVLVRDPSTNEIVEQGMTSGGNSATQGMIVLQNDRLLLTTWVPSYKTEVIPEFSNVLVPAGKTISVEIYASVTSANHIWGLSFENQNYTNGDFVNGELLISNYTTPTIAPNSTAPLGGNWQHFYYNNTNYDSKPNTARQIDNVIGGSASSPGQIILRYNWTNKNASEAKLFLAGFGADINVRLTTLNLTFKAGAVMKYTIN